MGRCGHITLPGYIIGHGNPVTVGWYWIGLIAITLVAWYIVSKRLFGQASAMLYILMTSLYFVFHSNSLINSDGSSLVIPIFFYFFIRYTQTQKGKFLAFALIALAAIFQLQIAIGIPFLILTFPYIAVIAFRNKKPLHILWFAIIPLLLGNFILFDLRHGNMLVLSAFRHLHMHDSTTSMGVLILNRLGYLMSGVEFLRFGPPNGQTYVAIILFAFLVIQIINNRYRSIYLTFLYFFFGYLILSLLNRFYLLGQYVLPLTPFIFLIFCSFITSKYSRIFAILFFIIYALNVVGAYRYILSLNRFIGYDQYSWKAIYTATSSLYRGEPDEFGYFVYSPDIMGYGPRYVMEYTGRVYHKNAYAFVKKPITYLFIEPAARNNPYTSKDKWKQDQIHVTSTPVLTRYFFNGYSYEKHLLTPEEQKEPFDPGVNPGFFYR